jgi:hypothetical protein
MFSKPCGTRNEVSARFGFACGSPISSTPPLVASVADPGPIDAKHLP